MARQMHVLSDAERERHARFVYARDRNLFLVSHALVRDALSRYAPVHPAEWEFAFNAYGRPEIAQPAKWRDLRFNLSHSAGRAVVAVARGYEIGVDVEAVKEIEDMQKIAERFFSPVESAALRRDPELFFDFWTLKEAYIKARGMGLALALHGFSFSLAEPGRPLVAFHEGCADDPEAWDFLLYRRDGFRLALAARGAGGPPRVIEREIIPMGAPSIV